MPGFEDRLRERLERAADPGDPAGAFEGVARRRARRARVRRVQVVALVLAVLVGTAGGGYALTRALRFADAPSPASQPSVANGRIAFVSDRDGNPEIYVMDADGGNQTRLTRHPGLDTDPAWSPDGTRIAFVSDRSGHPEIHVMLADGTGNRRLTRTPENRYGFPDGPDWSPDGDLIAFSGPVAGTANCDPACSGRILISVGIYTVPANATRSERWTSLWNVDPPRTVAPRYDRYPTWSSDGSRLLFDSFESQPFFVEDPGPSDPSGLHVMDSDGGDRSAVGPLINPDSTVAVHGADWERAGDRVAFTSLGGISLSLARFDENRLVDLRPVLGRQSIGADGFTEPAWSPDGTKLAFSARFGDEQEIFVVGADGSNPVNLTGHPALDTSPAWQPVLPGSASPSTAVASPPPAASATGPATPAASPTCEAPWPQTVLGDFDGDGQGDLATVAPGRCLEGAAQERGFVLRMRWAGGPGGDVRLSPCNRRCLIQGVVDFDGDGTDELVVDVQDRTDGGWGRILHVYALPASEAFGDPALAAGSGPGIGREGEPAHFVVGDGTVSTGALTCRPGDADGTVVVTRGEVRDSGVWMVHETVLDFRPTPVPPFGEFVIRSERDYEQAEALGRPVPRGKPCWEPAG